MPDKAHKDSKIGDIVKACDCTITDVNKKFYCITEGCPAIMSLISAATDDAYFRRLPTSPKHISVNCVIIHLMTSLCMR